MDSLKKIESALKNRAGQDDVVDYLIENVTTKELAEGLATALFELSKANKEKFLIRISQADFDKHFRIIGFRSDGTKERRGRPWKKKED